MPSFLDELKPWTDRDAAAVALGRALGLFSPQTQLADVKAVLMTNDPVANTLYGMLERLAWLGVLEVDEEGQGYRAVSPHLHALEGRDDVPSLAGGPPARARVELAVDAGGVVCVNADRGGFRYLARVFEEIADSALDPGARFDRDRAFRPTESAPEISLCLVEPEPT